MVSSLRSFRPGRIAMIGCAVALTACASARTEVIVVADTDLRGPGGIDTIFATVTDPSGNVQTSSARVGPGELPLPRTLGLVWDGSARLGPYTVRLDGNTGGGLRVTRVATFFFQEGRTLVLPMHLLASCTRATCSASSGQTCGENGCRATAIDPAELAEWTGTPPGLDIDASTPMVDAGPPPEDGGLVDAGRREDAGPRDAGPPDAGPPDAGPPDAGPPDSGPLDAGPDSCVAMSETCNAADDDCDGRVDETFDLDTDEMNCGACGVVCNFQNATGECDLGDCDIAACVPGFDDCNGDGTDGCEIDLQNDRLHCGGCGDRCFGGRDCCDADCSNSCP